MSEQEIIKKLENIKVSRDKGELYNFEAGIILNLITKQQEELEELRKYYATRKEVEELKDTINCLHESAKEYINKQVIRDKIEELQKEVHNYYGCEEANLVHDNMLAQVEVLKEILGEE